MIKLYRKTFIISCYISIVSFALSVAFESFRGRAAILGFFENYAIGIACSGALAAITTFLQFQAEYNKALKPYAIAVSTLVGILYSAIKHEDTPTAFEVELGIPAYELLESSTGEACQKSNIICMNRKQQRLFDEMRNHLYSIRGDLFLVEPVSDAVKSVTDSKRIFELIDLSLKAFPDSEEKEEIRGTRAELEHFISERDKREVPHP